MAGLIGYLNWRRNYRKGIYSSEKCGKGLHMILQKRKYKEFKYGYIGKILFIQTDKGSVDKVSYLISIYYIRWHIRSM